MNFPYLFHSSCLLFIPLPSPNTVATFFLFFYPCFIFFHLLLNLLLLLLLRPILPLSLFTFDFKSNPPSYSLTLSLPYSFAPLTSLSPSYAFTPFLLPSHSLHPLPYILLPYSLSPLFPYPPSYSLTFLPCAWNSLELLEHDQDYLPAVLGMATGFMVEKAQV